MEANLIELGHFFYPKYIQTTELDSALGKKELRNEKNPKKYIFHRNVAKRTETRKLPEETILRQLHGEPFRATNNFLYWYLLSYQSFSASKP